MGREIAATLRLLTHVGLVFEGEVAGGPPTVEVGGALAVEGAGRGAAVLGGAEPLEALLDDGRVLAVVVGVHLDVRRADVDLVAAVLKHTNKQVKQVKQVLIASGRPMY